MKTYKIFVGTAIKKEDECWEISANTKLTKYLESKLKDIKMVSIGGVTDFSENVSKAIQLDLLGGRIEYKMVKAS